MVSQEQFPAARTIVVVPLSMSCNLLASPLRLSLSRVGGTSQTHGAIGRCWKGDTRRWGEGQNASGEERVGKLYVDREEMCWEKGQNGRSSKFLHVYYSCIIILSTRYSQWLDICIEKIATVTNELHRGTPKHFRWRRRSFTEACRCASISQVFLWEHFHEKVFSRNRFYRKRDFVESLRIAWKRLECPTVPPKRVSRAKSHKI